LQILDLLLARVHVNGRHNEISIICKFEYAILLVDRVQVGCSDNVKMLVPALILG